MTRLVVFLLLVAGAALAYPWLAVGAGILLVAALVGAAVRGRTRRYAPPERGAVVRVSLDRRVALRRAYRELQAIEEGAGVPPTPPAV